MSGQKIEKLIEPALSSLGYELVRVRFSGGGQTSRATLQIMAEPSDGREMDVEDCAEISRHLAALLDVEDPITDAYLLEISSPGIDRPLTKEAHFTRFAGEMIKLTTTQPFEGQRRFKGRLTGVEDGLIRVETTTGRLSVRFDEIESAKIDPTELFSTMKQPPRTIKNNKRPDTKQSGQDSEGKA